MSFISQFRSGVIFAALALLSVPAMAQEKTSSTDPVGYFLGLDIGGSLSASGLKEGDFDLEVFVLGIADALGGRKSTLTEEQAQEVRGTLQALMQKRNQERQEEMVKMGVLNKEKGELFLVENLKKEGVKKLEGGVQIKVNTAGSGASPSISDRVTVHYTGKLIDGTVFDSSVQRGEPATFVLGQVIKGWQIALQQMKIGEKSTVYIPADLAYGDSGSPPVIGPNSVLVFEVELIEIP